MQVWNKDHFDIIETRNGETVVVQCLRPKHSPRAFVMYRGHRVEVYVQSTHQGGTGLIANVVAAHGFPFYSADPSAQGETSGAYMCSGMRVRADFVIVE